jgi:uncharacterized Zn finger protein
LYPNFIESSIKEVYFKVIFNTIYLLIYIRLRVEITQSAVDALAPDAPSIKNGLKIYNTTPWQVYKSDRAIWSAIKGSGKNPYLTQMDINAIAFKCSCPSRKFPCKHSLALGYYLANHPLDTIETQEEPLWVKEWLDKRQAKAVQKENKPQDPAKKAQKVASKWENLMRDIEYLELFLDDSIKNGILELLNKEPSYWERLTKAMVDRKISGLNRYIHTLASISTAQPNWQERVLDQLSTLHLLITTIKRHEELADDVKEEIALLLGWYKTKEELLADTTQMPLDDSWIVLSTTYEESDRLTTRKVYLYGMESQKWAYLLDFSYNGSFNELYLQGEIFKAKLLFYGNYQPRALIKVRGAKVEQINSLTPMTTLQEAHTHFIAQQDAFIFLYEDLALVENLMIIKEGEGYSLIDSQGYTMPLSNFDEHKDIATLIATRGEAFSGFILRQEDNYHLLSIVTNQRILPL